MIDVAVASTWWRSPASAWRLSFIWATSAGRSAGAMLRPLYWLSYGKFFVDPIYDWLVVGRCGIGLGLHWIDRRLIDGLVNLVGAIPPLLAGAAFAAKRRGAVLCAGDDPGLAGLDRRVASSWPKRRRLFVISHAKPAAADDCLSAGRRGADRAGRSDGAARPCGRRADDVARHARCWRSCWWRIIRSAGTAGVDALRRRAISPGSAQHPPIDIHFSVGLDGLSVWLFGLAALLTFTCRAGELGGDQRAAGGFLCLLLLLETGMLGVFAARDIILFYIFFEFTLIPLFFLIGIWGSEERRYAAIKFFLFTFAGSVLTFLGLLTIVIWQYFATPIELTFSISRAATAWLQHPLPNDAAHGYLQLAGVSGAVRRLCDQGAVVSAAHLAAAWPIRRRRRRGACCWPACC